LETNKEVFGEESFADRWDRLSWHFPYRFFAKDARARRAAWKSDGGPTCAQRTRLAAPYDIARQKGRSAAFGAGSPRGSTHGQEIEEGRPASRPSGPQGRSAADAARQTDVESLDPRPQSRTADNTDTVG